MVRGVTVSAGGFYGPQGRELRVPLADRRQNEKIEAFKFRGHVITNYEMESSAVAGLAALLGPTGGYLIGMLPAVFAGSIVMKAFPSKPRIMAIVSSLITTVIIYAVGLPWLKIRMELSVEAMFVAGLVPFIAGDLLKIAVSSIAGPAVRTRIAEMLNAS